MNTRKCLENPEFPILKKKVDKITNTLDSLFSTAAINGKNTIEQNSKLSLCDGSLLECCRPKSKSNTTPTPITTPTTASTTVSNVEITTKTTTTTTEK